MGTAEIDPVARSGSSVVQCPFSNCRLGKGIASVPAMRGAGAKVGFGVVGSVSNDRGVLVDEARHAMLLQRVARGADAMSAREALRNATRGIAEVLGRDGCGQIAPSKRADLALWRFDGLESAGSWDPSAVRLAGPQRVRYLFVDGAIARQNRLVARLADAV